MTTVASYTRSGQSEYLVAEIEIYLSLQIMTCKRIAGVLKPKIIEPKVPTKGSIVSMYDTSGRGNHTTHKRLRRDSGTTEDRPSDASEMCQNQE